MGCVFFQQDFGKAVDRTKGRAKVVRDGIRKRFEFFIRGFEPERARGRAGEPASGARANERARGRAGEGTIRTSASSSSELKYAASITGDSGSAGAGVGGRGKPKRGNCPILVAPSPPRPVAPSAARRAF